MQRFHCRFGAKVPAAGTQVVVIQMPDNRGPRIIQHPLDHAGGGVFIAVVSFKHRSNAFVGHELRLESEVGRVFGGAVASILCRGVHLNCLELATARVKIPVVVNRPEMVLAHHCLKAFDRRHRRPRTGFRVEAVGAAAAASLAMMLPGGCVFGPIAGRNVFVRPRHLDAAIARGARRLSSCG